ncbi:pilus assembly protein [Neorhizobium sp. T786]|uniref:TadE/TadG family type IV pilus assembly protein n=1 Tax=Pseudorhizobium xiangyangii TaxID=2883104 RepID=UPI001CFFD2AF|nr:TadE/TadG family type IV pilus assembly protein [Neorhizobium xiangyangii]MCB5201624.1 pilus assembly protein [Neorhizobium xiangyangii]
MCKTLNTSSEDSTDAGPKRLAWRLVRSRDGAAAIEFALLAIPYFLVVFAIIETFIAFTGEQLVANATDTMARQLRTGQITRAYNVATDKTEAQFRDMFCDEISILIQCSDDGGDKLILDVRSFSTFAEIPDYIPRKNGDLDAANTFTPGGPSSKNMLRAYYRWSVVTDLVRPYISGLRPADGSLPNEFLIVATATFQNEAY